MISGSPVFRLFGARNRSVLSKSRRIKSPRWVLGENGAKMAPKNFSRGTTFPSKIDPGAQRDFWMQFGNHLAPFWLPLVSFWLHFGYFWLPSSAKTVMFLEYPTPQSTFRLPLAPFNKGRLSFPRARSGTLRSNLDKSIPSKTNVCVYTLSPQLQRRYPRAFRNPPVPVHTPPLQPWQKGERLLLQAKWYWQKWRTFSALKG